MLDSGEGDCMNKYLVVGLAILIGISLGSSYYTYDMKERELEKGYTVSEGIAAINDQIAAVESLIPQIKEDISETETFIQEEQEKQEEIQSQIEALNQEKEELQQQIDLYEEIDERDPRVLITVDDPVVRAKVEEVTRLSRTTEEKQQAIFEYVRKEIEYVTEGNPKEYKYPKSFLKFKFDFWQLPRETIEWRKGDCEDQAILLCTMMRIAGVPASDVQVVLGLLHVNGTPAGGHAWCEFKIGDEWYVLESTCPTCNYFEKSYYYTLLSPKIWGWFNDEEYYEEESKEAGGSVTFILE